MAKVSILVPARNETYEVSPGVTVLERTIQDNYDTAPVDFVGLVGFGGSPYQGFPDYPNLKVIRFPDARGTKPCLNDMALEAEGKYLFKLDGHCSLSEGFDEVLQSEMRDNWVVAPRLYVLNPQTWEWQDERFRDYFILPCPLTDQKSFRFQAGVSWDERTRQRLDTKIDENMKLHGSSFFMSKKFFFEDLGLLSSDHPDQSSGEDIEISLKTWLGPWDGRVITNKSAWIGHMHKGKGQPRSWNASQKAINASYLWTANYWMKDQWQDRARNLHWLINRFEPVPT